jgi:hypothetical protein
MGGSQLNLSPGLEVWSTIAISRGACGASPNWALVTFCQPRPGRDPACRYDSILKMLSDLATACGWRLGQSEISLPQPCSCFAFKTRVPARLKEPPT